MNSPPLNVASLPVIASTTIDEPIKSDEVLGFDVISVQAWPFQVQAGATTGKYGHIGCALGCRGLAIGQAMAGSANGPLVSSTTRPATGSVASEPLPNPMSGVEPDALDQSVPFHNQVASFGETIVVHEDGARAVPPFALDVALGSGAMSGIGVPGGMLPGAEPEDPDDVDPEEDDDPEPPTAQAIGSPFDPAASCSPIRITSWLTGS
jgi:hypothetical protein